MSQFYSPYREKYGKDVIKHDIHPRPPQTGYLDHKVLSTNLKLGEIRKASSIMPDEVNLFTYIPLDARVVQAFQALRDALGKPIHVNSAFRSVRFEFSKKRSGDSQHTHGTALDLRGEGIVDLLKEALETKNKLYQRLRAIGVNGFGIYEEKNFVHIDVRAPKADGGFALWFGDEDSELKKKGNATSTNPLKWILGAIGFVLVAIGSYKKLKK